VTAEEQRASAAESAAEMVEPGQHVGLGSGSTAGLFLRAIASRIASGALPGVVGVPTSITTRRLAEALGVPISEMADVQRLDLAVDGADEVDPSLDLIKGAGGAFLREKIVAFASDRFVVVVDDSKLVAALGERSPVPVEVPSFAWRPTFDAVRSLGCEPVLRERNGCPYVTDGGNYVLDCDFGRMDDPRAVQRALASVPGVLADGLFLGVADAVLVGGPQGVRLLERG
jgi:ribose 5-phosphate isomerase A